MRGLVFILFLIFGILAATPAVALTDHEVDRLMDESARMRALVQRVQALNGPAPRLPGAGPALSAAGAAPAPTSAMLAAAQREQWFRSIEQGVLGRFAAEPEATDAGVPVAVGFVGGDEEWYGALRLAGQERRARPTDPLDVQARVLVAPRLEDGSFFHVGISYRSAGAPDEAAEFFGASLLPATDDLRSGRSWGIDLGYAWDDYRVQAEYRQADAAPGSGIRPPAVADPATDGFYIQGAWRISGEPEAGRYAPGLLRHLTPRAEGGIWELVVRYASLDPAAFAGPGRDSDSVLLGIHWRADSTLALELDYVEGNGEDFRALNDGGLTLRGTLSF